MRSDLQERKFLSFEISSLQIVETGILSGFSVLLPLLIHIIPYHGKVPLGAYLLPMFYAPFLAVALCRWHVGFLVALAGPIGNYFLTGNPSLEVLPILTAELAIFTFICLLFVRSSKNLFLIAPLACVLAKIATYFLFHSAPRFEILSHSLMQALPGFWLLFLLNMLVVKMRHHD